MDVLNEQNWPGISFGSQRLWNSGTSWAEVEPERGVYNWSTLDIAVANAENNGTALLLTLGMAPGWAAPSATTAPAQMSDWDAYVSSVVTRYQGRIAAYEIWNEPSSSAYWTGTPSQMLALASDAYRIIKGIDAKAEVVSPGGDQNFLTEFLQGGGAAFVDVVGYHLSPSPEAPETVVSLAQSVQNIMGMYGAAAKPLWNTANSWGEPATFSTEDDKAAFVARSLVLNASSGVGRVFWYAWDDDTGTTLNLSDSAHQPTEAGYAYQQVEQWLSGAAMNGCSSDSDSTWRCQLSRGGRPAWIVWNPVNAVAVSTMGMSAVIDLKGNQQDISGAENITAGAMPVLLQ